MYSQRKILQFQQWYYWVNNSKEQKLVFYEKRANRINYILASLRLNEWRCIKWKFNKSNFYLNVYISFYKLLNVEKRLLL